MHMTGRLTCWCTIYSPETVGHAVKEEPPSVWVSSEAHVMAGLNAEN